jgi:uncharacterized protein
MYFGTLQVRLLVRESRTLKDKRQVVRSILDKLRSNFNVSAAEVGHLEDLRVLELGIAAVGPEMALVQGVLQKIQEAMRTHPVAQYLDGKIETSSRD